MLEVCDSSAQRPFSSWEIHPPVALTAHNDSLLSAKTNHCDTVQLILLLVEN